MKESINKTTLAQMYGWNLQFLVNRINTLSELVKELEGTGYYNNQRIFTPKQVKIIFKHLCNPTIPL
ncbi:MAG: DUF4248 domain-containing protein [Bacteroidota bacterium]